MKSDVFAIFTEKAREFGTQKRVYCARQACSVFLGPQSAAGLFFAPATFTCTQAGCNTRTCSYCKVQLGSGNHTCAKDAQEGAVLSLGVQQGWQRCPGCAAMVELNLGCFHITCRCRTEFCYLCQKRWKTCTCPQWDERRLYVAAEERVQLQHGLRVAQRPAVRAAPAVNQPELRAAGQIRQHDRSNIFPREATIHRPAPQLPAIHRTYASISAATTSTPQTSTPHTHAVRSAGSGSTLSTPAAKQAKPAAARTRERLIQEAMEELRVNHECSHDRWKYRQGGGRCQHCYHSLPNYLFVSPRPASTLVTTSANGNLQRCVGCQTLACNRCRRNRL